MKEPLGAPWAVLGAISAGGAVGALCRWSLAEAWPTGHRDFPWPTLLANASGCLLIGVLMVIVTDLWSGRRLLRPFLGVGVLGGYTTFSTYAVDIARLLRTGSAVTALAYLAVTVLAALTAAYAGTAATRWALRVGRSTR